MHDDLDLLRNFGRDGAEDAFAELVRRHVNLVYSAALRQVRSPQLAEEVSQSVFTDLASDAARLQPGTVLAAWLYQVTRRTAIDVVRREARRQLREQIAVEMNAMNSTASDWALVEPLLDDAMAALDETDRTAVLLRYFENKSLREVGAALGTSDDTVQKRVSRAVDKLREFFSQRGVTVGAGAITAAVSAHAVQAAPVGLAAAISTSAALAGSAVVTVTTATTLQTIAMTTLQKLVVTTALIAAVGVAIYENRQSAELRKENQRLVAQLAPLTEQVRQLQKERDTGTNRLAAVATELASVKAQPTEVHKLRGQVGVLRQERDAIGSKSALSKITADPETRKMMREQQKMGMSLLYTDLAKNLNLTPEVKGQFQDLLADGVMDGVDLITQALHDKASGPQIDQLFTAHEAAFNAKVAALIGQDGLVKYQEFSKDLLATLSAAEVEKSLTGDKAAKAEKKQQFQQVVQEETRAGLAALGLPADYQAVPMLNFRNIASEETAARNLKLLDDIYARVATRAATFLTEDELKKFQAGRPEAVKANQTMLMMNRKLMAPIAQ
ncbi:MAG: sigma-70 family RNA polymerase sigma factor [Proteobacteria bacterium]|nr:sigma-70 family RNA polymerase sigma factor [Pseudomonadota bacterium]